MPTYEIEVNGETFEIDSQRDLSNDELKRAAGQYKAPEQQQQQDQEKKGYFGQLGDFVTEDIPSAFKGAADRIEQRGNRLWAPTAFGEMAKNATGTQDTPTGDWVQGIAGTPERIGRLIGGGIGSAGEVAGVPLELAMNGINRLSGGKIGDAMQPLVESAVQSKPVQKLTAWWEGLSEGDRANLGSAVDMLDAFGYGVGKGAAKATGEGFQDAGKRFLGGDLKIKKSLAERGYGKTIDMKKQNILDNISKYNLESVKSNFSGMAKRADEMAVDRVRQADQLISQAAKSAPKSSYVDDVLASGIDYVEDAAALGKGDQAISVLEKIMSDAVAKNMTGESTIEQLVAFKRRLDPDGNLFKLGPAMNDADNLERGIRKHLYKQAVSKINEIVPEAGKLNWEAKELWDITNVAADAASRTSNKYAVSLYDVIAGTGGLAATAATKDPNVALGTLGLVGLGKSAGQGRGAAAVLESGKALTKIAPAIGGLDLGATSLGTRVVIPNDEEENLKRRR